MVLHLIKTQFEIIGNTITKGELDELAKRVNELKQLTEEICKAKIGEIGDNHIQSE